MTKLTTDVGGEHVLIEDPDGHVIRLPIADLADLAAQIALIEPTEPGTRARDRDGDIWVLRPDGLMETPVGIRARPWAEVVERYGPLHVIPGGPL